MAAARNPRRFIALVSSMPARCPVAPLPTAFPSSPSLLPAPPPSTSSQVLISPIAPTHIELQGDSEQQRAAAFRSTAAEWVLFTHCRAFVFTESGFSKTAALFSLRRMSAWMMARHADGWLGNGWRDSCDPERPTTMAVLGNTTRWSGI